MKFWLEIICKKSKNRFIDRKSALKEEGLKISRNKTEYIEYDFGVRGQEVDGTRRAMTKRGDVIGEVESFKYLGSFVQRDGRELWHEFKT